MPEREPVLGMLRARRRAEEEPEPKRGGLRKLATALGVTIAVLAPAGVVAALTTRDTSEDRADQAATGEGGSRPFAPESQAVADPFPTDPSSASRYPVAYIDKRTAIYDKPNGKVRLRLTPKTEWNSPRILGVVERRGNWLAVLVPDLKNGEVGWLKDSQVARLETVAWSIHADLSKRALGGAPQRQGRAQLQGGGGAARVPHPGRPLRGHGQAAGSTPRTRRTAAACSRSPATRPSCRAAGPAATAWPCTPPATPAAWARL